MARGLDRLGRHPPPHEIRHQGRSGRGAHRGKDTAKRRHVLAPRKIPIFGALADEWITGRIEESRKPGEGYRPSTLSQWQTPIAHMRTGFDLIKLSDIDARAIERAIAKWRLPKKDGGRGLSQRTAAKVRTTMSRVFRFGISSKRGIVADPTKFIEKAKKVLGRVERNGRAALYRAA